MSCQHPDIAIISVVLRLVVELSGFLLFPFSFVKKDCIQFNLIMHHDFLSSVLKRGRDKVCFTIDC